MKAMSLSEKGRSAVTVPQSWVKSVCYMCYNCCGILVRRVDGEPVEVVGDPDNPMNRGRLCAKGQAALMSYHHPRRVRTPLIRTNPKKGVGVDPE